jgi:lipoprotein-anchoring transpeptidase ErfK/SrfK
VAESPASARRAAAVAVASLVALAGAVLAAGPARAGEPAAPTPAASPAAAAPAGDPYRLTRRRAHLAQVVVPTRVRARPGGGRRRERLGTAARWGGGPVRLLVLRSRVAAGGRRWLQVRLPERPNDRAGWIPGDRTRLRATAWRVVVSLGRRTVTVRRRGRVVRRFRAVVGSPSTPSPRGLFAISERIRQPSGVLGPWALHLTAHSEVLDDYGGGPGRVAIHGRAGALLADPLGTAASHGCVRLGNRAVSWLARRAIEGTPVRVRR